MSNELISTPLSTTEYPRTWHEEVTLKDGTRATLRFARPEDAHLLPAYFANFSAEDLYRRFFSRAKRDTITHNRALELYRDALENELCRIFVLVGTHGELLGVCRAMEHVEHHHETGTFEVSFSARTKGMGIGGILMSTLLAWAHKTPQVQRLEAVTMTDNKPMRALFEKHHFTHRIDPDDHSLVEYTLQIRSN